MLGGTIMNMVPVKSSNLVSVGYEDVSRELAIRFDSGTYIYYDVPPYIHTGLMDAPSKGSYHHQHIKNKYRFKKID